MKDQELELQVAPMSNDTMEYLNVLFGVCKRFKTDYYHATPKQREFIDAVATHEYGGCGIGYQSSTVLDEPEREAGTTSIPIPQREESENIPSPDLPEQLENVQQSGNEIAERGMQT